MGYLEAARHSKLQDGTTQHILDVGESIRDFYKIILFDGVLQLLKLLSDERDAESAALFIWDAITPVPLGAEFPSSPSSIITLCSATS